MKSKFPFITLGFLVRCIYGGALLGLALEVAVQWFTYTVLVMSYLDFLVLLTAGILLLYDVSKRI